jgi:hypothetical protein
MSALINNFLKPFKHIVIEFAAHNGFSITAPQLQTPDRTGLSAFSR